MESARVTMNIRPSTGNMLPTLEPPTRNSKRPYQVLPMVSTLPIPPRIQSQHLPIPPRTQSMHAPNSQQAQKVTPTLPSTRKIEKLIHPITSLLRQCTRQCYPSTHPRPYPSLTGHNRAQPRHPLPMRERGPLTCGSKIPRLHLRRFSRQVLRSLPSKQQAATTTLRGAFLSATRHGHLSAPPSTCPWREPGIQASRRSPQILGWKRSAPVTPFGNCRNFAHQRRPTRRQVPASRA